MDNWRLDYALLEASARGRRLSVRLRATHNGVTAIGAALILNNLWIALAWYALGIAAILFDVRMGQRFLDAAPEARRFRGAAFFASSLLSATLYSSMALGLAIFGGTEGRLAAAFMTMSTFIGLMTHLAETSTLMLFMAAPSAIVLAAVPLLPTAQSLAHPIAATAGLVLIFATFVSYLVQSGANQVSMIKRLKQMHAESETRRLEAEARRAEAEAANRTKSEFLANMSHELRTPLNVVIGYSEILQEDLEQEGRARMAQDAVRVHQAARTLLGHVDLLLDLSKIDAGRMDLEIAEVDVGGLVLTRAEAIRSAAAKKGLELLITVAPRLGMARTDGQKLAQCLDNLLSNAVKFTEAGKIEIIAVRTAIRGVEWLHVTIADTGIGMSGDHAARAFEIFSQADTSATRAYGGLGLGLAVTRRLVHLLGGEVTLVSEPGTGSTFTLSVPMQAEDAHVDADPAPAPVAHGEKADVLVIDDDPATREIVRRAAARIGFSVRGAADGREGVEAAREGAPSIIVLDIGLPDMDGWAVLERIRALPDTARTPVIVLTAIAERAKAMEAGAAFYLRKPADRDALSAALLRHARPPVAQAPSAPDLKESA